MKAIIETLQTVTPIEWGFWAVVVVAGIKGFIEYPNCIENHKRREAAKVKPKDPCLN